MGDAGPQQVRCAPEPGEGGDQCGDEVTHGVGPAIRQLGFAVPPHALVGIQLRRVAGQRFEPQAREALPDRADERSAMNRAVVPDDDDGTPEVAQELAEEGADVRRPDVGGVELEVEATALASRAEREARNNGHAVVALPVAEYG